MMSQGFHRPEALVLLVLVGLLALRRGGLTLPSLLGRGLTLVCAVLAIAGPWTDERTPDVAVVVALDAARASTVPAGLPEDATIVRWEEEGEPTSVDALANLALARAPASAQRHLVVASDGSGPGLEAATARRLLRADAVLHTVEVPRPAEAAIRSWSMPPCLQGARELRFTAQVSAPSGTPWRLEVDGAAVASGQVDGTELDITGPAPGPGLHTVTLVLDGNPEDAQSSGPLLVADPDRVLVHGIGRSAVVRALASTGLMAQAVEQWPASLPPGGTFVVLQPELGQWPEGRGEGLRRWVRDQGGNLLVAGGPAGLASDVPSLEGFKRMLPVDLPREVSPQPAPLAIVFVLDRSDSMSRAEKMPMAKAALLESARHLHPETLAGLLMFSDHHDWALEPTPVGDAAGLVSAIEAVTLYGGTDIYPALATAGRAVADVPAAARHVVLLTDGQGISRLQQHRSTVETLARRGITVSTVALSEEADQAELAEVAAMTGGRAWVALSPDQLPRLLLEETMLVQDENAVDEARTVTAVPGSRLVDEGSLGAFPALGGLNRVRGHTTADVALMQGQDPLLASWRHGLGSATVFASELGGTWGAQWETWGGWSRFLGDLVRAVQVRRSSDLVTARVREVAGGMQVTVHIEDRLGRPSLTTSPPVATAYRGPGRDPVPVDMHPAGPGEFRGLMAGAEPCVVQIGFQSQGLEVWARSEPAPVARADEPADRARLEASAIRGGGVLNPSAKDLEAAPGAVRTRRTELAPWLMWAALIGLILDVGARRLGRLRPTGQPLLSPASTRT